jgi:hypothetical protein
LKVDDFYFFIFFSIEITHILWSFVCLINLLKVDDLDISNVNIDGVDLEEERGDSEEDGILNLENDISNGWQGEYVE